MSAKIKMASIEETKFSMYAVWYFSFILKAIKVIHTPSSSKEDKLSDEYKHSCSMTPLRLTQNINLTVKICYIWQFSICRSTSWLMKILPHLCTCASQCDTHDQVNKNQYQYPMSMAICKIKKCKGMEVNMMDQLLRDKSLKEGISKQKSAPILVTHHICPWRFFFC